MPLFTQLKLKKQGTTMSSAVLIIASVNATWYIAKFDYSLNAKCLVNIMNYCHNNYILVQVMTSQQQEFSLNTLYEVKTIISSEVNNINALLHRHTRPQQSRHKSLTVTINIIKLKMSSFHHHTHKLTVMKKKEKQNANPEFIHTTGLAGSSHKINKLKQYVCMYK